jgi:hypothetical protein
VLVENALDLPAEQPARPITLINTVPSAIAALLRVGGIPASVRTVNLAGEPLPQETVDALYAIPTIERVYDLYGPSEDTTYSTFTLRRAGGRASIGRPIANTRAYVLDRSRELLPVGIPGELWIGGEGLARGYLGQPGLTAERFLDDPFAIERGAADPSRERLYRTGDLVRWRRDGTLEYLGRLDHQVKLRGFRIELGEIESALRTHPDVGAAVVVVRADDAGERRLVAYVAARTGAEAPSRDALLALLRSRLPQYMVPSAIVVLDAVPLTPNGKVDRKALPAPLDTLSDEVAPVAPRDAIESVVAGVWSDVLGRSAVGVETSFLDLGGHSLLATRVVGQLSRIFRTALTLRRFFQTPTVAGLARAVRDAEGSPGRADAIARAYQRIQQMSPEEREQLRRTRARPAQQTD